MNIPANYSPLAVAMAAQAMAPGADTLLPLPVVMLLTNLSRSKLYLDIQRGTFPAPVKIGAKKSAWRSSEVQAWIAGQRKRSEMKAAA